MNKTEQTNETNCNTEMIAGERPPSVLNESKVDVKKPLLSTKNIDIANNLDLARLILSQKRDIKTNESTYLYVAGLLYFYNDGFYKPVSDKDFKLQIRGLLNTIQNFNSNNSKINEVIENIKAESRYAGDETNNFFTDESKSGRFISMKNGILNLDKAIKGEIELEPHTPKFFTTSKLPYEFNPEANMKVFNKILFKILPDVEDQKMLQQWFGYHLLNTLKYQKMMLFKGTGANGKGVVSTVMQLFLGKNNISYLPVEYFSAKEKFKVAETNGKLANINDEMSPDDMDETFLKNFVSGGKILAEKKFKNPFTLHPTAKLTFSLNNMPRVKDKTNGFWRRVLLLNFKVTISEGEKNTNFVEESFWINSGELQGVFNWALIGAAEIIKNEKIFESSNSVAALSNEKMESGHLKSWITQNIQFKEGSLLNRTLVFNSYKNFLVSKGLKAPKDADFFNEVLAVFPKAILLENPVNINGERARGFKNLALNLEN